MMSVFLKITAIIFIGAVLVIVLKTDRSEMGFLLSVGVSVVALFLIVKQFYPSVKSLLEIYEKTTETGAVISVVVKALIISYLAEFCGNLCRDFGLSSLGDKAELAGKCTVFALSVPLINSIIKTCLELTSL